MTRQRSRLTGTMSSDSVLQNMVDEVLDPFEAQLPFF